MMEDGSDLKMLYGTAAEENDPHIYQDNLYFKSTRDGEWDIYRYNLKDKVLTRLTNNNIPDWNIRLTRDGTRLLYTENVKNRWRLRFMNLAIPIPAGVIAEAIKDSTKIISK